ncbi:unnamed protein product, partial [Mesorhabditis spiculigera]
MGFGEKEAQKKTKKAKAIKKMSLTQRAEAVAPYFVSALVLLPFYASCTTMTLLLFLNPYCSPRDVDRVLAFSRDPGFSCSGKQDGFYATGCSNTYWGCVNGMAVQHSCNGNDLWFTAEGSRCDYKEFVPECGGRTPAPQPQSQQPAQSPPQMVQGCQGKMDGIYPTTSCTKQYLSCVGGLGMLNNCHDGLIFNEAISACDYKENVLSCGGQAPAQDVPQQPIQPRPTLTFDCTGLEDGYWSTRQCSDKYAYCQMGQATMEANCPAGTAFFNRAQQCLNKNNHPECVRQQPQPQQMLPQSQPQQQQQPNYGGLSQPLPAQDSNPCSGKVNGLYSQGCSNKYVMCNNFAPSTFFCPGSFVFDDVTKRCTYANQVSGCMSPVLPQSPVIRTPQPFPQPFVQPQPMFYRQPNKSPPPMPDSSVGRYAEEDGPMNTVEDSLDAGVAQNYLSSAPYMEQETEDCSALPNGTNTMPHVFQCDLEEDSDPLFIIHNAAVTNYTGDTQYPVDFTSPIRIFLDVTSRVNRRFDNLGVDVSVYKRSTGWFGCGWLFIPSFTLLNNGDVCEENQSCPLARGRQVLELPLEPQKLFTRFFRMFHNDMQAYQLILRVRDNSRPFDDLFCASIQTRISFDS